ncbi:MAG: DUF3106 domain-containing protein [Opitutae bacterium]|nr:DUF3106 domain-containing protein [Opitutae bacterium]
MNIRLYFLFFIFPIAGLHTASSQEGRDRKQDSPDKVRPSTEDKRQRIPGSGPPRQQGGYNRLEMLRRLLDAPPEQLRMIRETIRRIEQMTPPERDAMRKRLKNFRDLPSNNRSKMLSDFQTRQECLNRHWQSFPPDKRDKEKQNFEKLPLEKRKAYINRILNRKFPPVPPHSEKGKKHGPLGKKNLSEPR